jgi:hypothetical protein
MRDSSLAGLPLTARAHLAFHHLAERAHDLLGSLQLGDVALGPGGERPGGVQRLLVHRGDKDGNQGVGCPEAADKIEPAGPVFQGDIHDHRVGATGLHCLQGPGEIGRFTTDAEISGRFEQRSHAGPENRVVVHQQNLGHCRSRHQITFTFQVGNNTGPREAIHRPGGTAS